MSALRDRMLRDMTVRGFSPRTHKAYVRQVVGLARHYVDADRVKVMDLDVDEFLRRFLLHVLPKRFVRIRYFGFLASRTRTRQLLNVVRRSQCDNIQSVVTTLLSVYPRCPQ